MFCSTMVYATKGAPSECQQHWKRSTAIHCLTDCDTTNVPMRLYHGKVFPIKLIENPSPTTLTLAYLSCKFAFRAHFQCAVRTYDLKCVENANQLVSTQGKTHEYSYVLGSVSALTNQDCLKRKN